MGWRIIVPVQAIPFYRLKKGNIVVRISLYHMQPEITLYHFTALLLTQTIDRFIAIEHVGLKNTICAVTCIIKWSKVCAILPFSQKEAAPFCIVADHSRLKI